MVFSARLMDINGRTRSCRAYYAIDDGITVNTLMGHLEGFANAIQGLSSAGIQRLSISIEDNGLGDFSSIPRAPSGNEPIEQTGVFNFNAVGPVPRRWGLAIPGFTNTVLIDGRIDLGDPAIVDMIADIGTGSAFTNEHYQPLGTLADAFLSFRRDRKQLQRSSFETA